MLLVRQFVPLFFNEVIRMNVWDAIQNRTSIRKYRPDPIEAEKREKIAEAFRRAPSARNQQTWKLLWVEDPALKAKIREASPGHAPMLEEAPAVLVAVGLEQEESVMTNGHRPDTVNLSIAMSYAILEAFELGLGTCWMAYYKEEELRNALGLPENTSIVAISPIGYGAEEPSQRPRKPLEEVFEVL